MLDNKTSSRGKSSEIQNTAMIMEQYKIMAESVQKIAGRRAQTNQFYVSILSGLIVVISIANRDKFFGELQNIILMTISMLGAILCLIWYINIRSYGIRSGSIYKVLNELEKGLPYPCFAKSWEIMQKGNKFVPLARIELFVPLILLLPYLAILCYSLYYINY